MVVVRVWSLCRMGRRTRSHQSARYNGPGKKKSEPSTRPTAGVQRNAEEGVRDKRDRHIVDDAQELLALILPRLLLPAPHRKKGSQNAPKTHAEVMAETAPMRQEARRLLGERLTVAKLGNGAERRSALCWYTFTHRNSQQECGGRKECEMSQNWTFPHSQKV